MYNIGESGEVVYVDRDFSTARIFLKNITGDFALGNDFGENSNATFIQNDPNCANNWPHPKEQRCPNAISGSLIVVDSGTNIAVSTNNTLQDPRVLAHHRNNPKVFSQLLSVCVCV